jgi:hypothetical protein
MADTEAKALTPQEERDAARQAEKKREADALAATAAARKAELNPVLTVNRSDIALPAWMKKPLFPDLVAGAGPDGEYDTKTLEISLVEGQEGGKLTGEEVLALIQANDLIKRGLGLADGVAVMLRSPEAFGKFFPSPKKANSDSQNVVALWAAIGEDQDGNIRVPLLIPSLGKVAMVPGDLKNLWGKTRPLVVFPAAS